LKRVNVKGISGSGKSTFAAELARRLELPYIELDALHHGPNWSEPTAEEFQDVVRAAMAAAPGGWVIDGNYEGKLGSLVLDEAEQIVWLDPPLHAALGRLFRRTRGRIKAGEELWNGNRESWQNVLPLFSWTIRSFFRHRRQWPRKFAGDPRFVRLRSFDEARRWLERQ
jgi:adenylate kinase family enzyme